MKNIDSRYSFCRLSFQYVPLDVFDYLSGFFGCFPVFCLPGTKSGSANDLNTGLLDDIFLLVLLHPS